MSPGSWITLAILGTFTLIAVRPPRRPRPLARAAYMMGLSVNEVPHLAVGLPLLAATVESIASGGVALDGASALTLAGTTAVGGGLVVIARRGIAAWPTVGDAVERAGFERPIRPAGWVWRTLVTPIPFRPRRVARIADLRYGAHRRQRLDVYVRRDRPTGRPVLVYLHSGGYYSGGKHREGRALLHRLADRGWVCISANYRLRPSAGFEEHLADARSVLDWARTHAGGYGGDPDRVVMAGSSAGAHLTSLLALDPDTHLTAAICLYGYYGRYYGHTEAERVVSTPFALPATEAPPCFIAHGRLDTWTPVEAARRFATKLRRESPNPVVEVELPGGQHGFDLWRSWRYSAVIAGIESFVSDPRLQSTSRVSPGSIPLTRKESA
jgi:acetyl esterase/lipase